MERRRDPYFGGPVCFDTPAIRTNPSDIPKIEADAPVKKPRRWPRRTLRTAGALAIGLTSWRAYNEVQVPVANSGVVAMSGSLKRDGGTNIDIPSGPVEFDTHQTPLSMKLQVKRVNQEAPQDLRDICEEELRDSDLSASEQTNCT